SSRLRQRRGQIAGLHNFGRTCFLNTLIQALASCPQFIAWLQLHNGIHSTDKKGLISSLLNTLEVVNGTHPTLRADPYSPGAIIRALSNLGWVIPPDEHDAHELFGVILSSLEEEVSKPQKIGCLGGSKEEKNLPTNQMGRSSGKGMGIPNCRVTTREPGSNNVCKFVRILNSSHAPRRNVSMNGQSEEFT
uniref:ubiquitinyl hydrolase 1 n=1 Tax=Megaselia scalaris TaxID=36166 RepID=T1H1E8_MEGSC